MKIDGDGCVAGYTPVAPAGDSGPACISTGSFMLGSEIFQEEPVQMKSGEYGLPHTLIRAVGTIKFRAVPIRQWLPINTPAELQHAEMGLVGATKDARSIPPTGS